jgi:hypothetical protein
MGWLYQIGGVLLLLLAAFKVVGCVALLLQADSDHAAMWFVKQLVYAGTAALVGVSLLRRRASADPTGVGDST